MHRTLLSLSSAAFSIAIGFISPRPSGAEEPVAPAVLVETSDGSVLAGTLPAGSEITLVQQGNGETKIAVRDVRRLSVSILREAETGALEAEVRKLRDRLGDDDAKIRDAASEALVAMPGAIAPFLSRLTKDSDPEVVIRAEAVLKSLKSKHALLDSRDLVVLDKKVLRGWLKLDKLDLLTAFGPVTIARAEIRALRNAAVPEDPAADDREEEWPPPMAQQPPRLPLQVVAWLSTGSRLVGLAPTEALALVDDTGKPICSDRLLSLTRDSNTPGFFQVLRKGVPVFRAALAAKDVVISGASRQWKVPVAMIDSIEIGPLHARRSADSMEQLVQEWLQATAQGTEAPTQRFWVYIDGQPANPWDSEGKKGMTWSLLKVHEKVALVGADKSTDAYKGDTSIEEVLPILCVRKRDLAAPEGVDPKDFYAGWSGGEIRLTKPVAGKEMTSLEAANQIIKDQFGDGWEIGEHHSPSGGGWHWWGYWGDAPEEGK